MPPTKVNSIFLTRINNLNELIFRGTDDAITVCVSSTSGISQYFVNNHCQLWLWRWYRRPPINGRVGREGCIGNRQVLYEWIDDIDVAIRVSGNTVVCIRSSGNINLDLIVIRIGWSTCS